MRKKVFELSKKLSIPILNCDMFPFKGRNVLDFNLSESNILNVAYGMSILEPVFVYGVCDFLFKFDALKLLKHAKHSVILFNAGGSNNPCYSNFGSGHTFNNDLKAFRLIGANIYTPELENFEGLVKELVNSNGLKIVRLT